MRLHRLLPLLAAPAIVTAGLCLLGAGALVWRRLTRGYEPEAVEFESDGVVLRGVLLVPQGEGPHPAVVLVHGLFLGLRSFYRFYADLFARLGVAVLVYDKRGMGASEGKHTLLDLEQQARDAAAAWQSLRRDQRIDPLRIGFWGYSIGGAATLRAAELVEEPAFVIGLSQPALPLGEILNYYSCGALAGGIGREARRLRQLLWNFSRSGRGWKVIYRRLKAAMDKPWYRAARLPMVLDAPSADNTAQAMRAGNPLPFRWNDPDLDFDPLPLLGRLSCPILLQYGDRDVIVPSRQFLQRVEVYRQTHYLPHLTVLAYAGGDHAIHRPGLPFNLPPCFCHSYLADMQHWLAGVAGLQRPALSRLRPMMKGALFSRY